jgi:hypothetical protein
METYNAAAVRTLAKAGLLSIVNPLTALETTLVKTGWQSPH